MLWGLLNEHLALLVSLFSLPLKWQCNITAEDPKRGQYKKAAWLTRENCVMKPKVLLHMPGEFPFFHSSSEGSCFQYSSKVPFCRCLNSNRGMRARSPGMVKTKGCRACPETCKRQQLCSCSSKPAGRILKWIEDCELAELRQLWSAMRQSSWRPAISGILYESVLGPFLFSVFISSLDERVESIFR